MRQPDPIQLKLRCGVYPISFHPRGTSAPRPASLHSRGAYASHHPTPPTRLLQTTTWDWIPGPTRFTLPGLEPRLPASWKGAVFGEPGKRLVDGNRVAFRLELSEIKFNLRPLRARPIALIHRSVCSAWD